jgi:hypothetical protein
MTPIDRLVSFLQYHHSDYTIDDVALSPSRGSLICLKSCPWKDCPSSVKGEHYHTIGICGVGYPNRDKNGRFISPYKLWNELKDFGFRVATIEQQQKIGGFNGKWRS